MTTSFKPSLAGAIASAAFAALAFSSTASHAVVTFDNITAPQAAGNITSTGSTPNTFIGDAYTLLAGTSSITGFDVYPANLSGTAFTSLKLNLYVWGTVNTGTVSATAPAFGNLLGTYSFTSSTGNFASGSYYSFESATPGVTPGLTLSAPLTISSQTIGLTMNVQGSTDGVTYSNVNSLTSLLSYGVAPTVGSLPFNGYYRNAAGEVNGNFTSTLRSLGFTNQAMAVRIYGNVSPVPEAQTWAMMSLGLAALLVARRRLAS